MRVADLSPTERNAPRVQTGTLNVGSSCGEIRNE